MAALSQVTLPNFKNGYKEDAPSDLIPWFVGCLLHQSNLCPLCYLYHGEVTCPRP